MAPCRLALDIAILMMLPVSKQRQMTEQQEYRCEDTFIQRELGCLQRKNTLFIEPYRHLCGGCDAVAV